MELKKLYFLVALCFILSFNCFGQFCEAGRREEKFEKGVLLGYVLSSNNDRNNIQYIPIQTGGPYGPYNYGNFGGFR